MKNIHWKKAEELAGRKLKKEFRQKFIKNGIRIGNKTWNFDLVSENEPEDERIIAQVKSCGKRFETQTLYHLETLFKRDYLFDCLLLEKAKGYKKFFFLASDKKLFNEFKHWSKGLISPEVELRFIDAWRG
jgi:hypothetical protein